MAITYNKIFFAKGDFLSKLVYWPHVPLYGEFSKVFIALLAFLWQLICGLFIPACCLS